MSTLCSVNGAVYVQTLPLMNPSNFTKDIALVYATRRQHVQGAEQPWGASTSRCTARPVCVLHRDIVTTCRMNAQSCSSCKASVWTLSFGAKHGPLLFRCHHCSFEILLWVSCYMCISACSQNVTYLPKIFLQNRRTLISNWACQEPRSPRPLNWSSSTHH